ncbi:MAG TPA: tetratricopeptide repeat protein, partial [Caldilineaceae bacterium]|nr:tetratricopeptide repeat protein [Caldilineaceae bacterium]
MSTAEQDQAIVAAERATKDNPTDAALQVALGMAYFNAGRLDEAIAAFQCALGLNPRSAEAYNGIGRVC